jgi:hypothetical protein
MRPAQSMFATQEDWQKALVQWMNETPTLTNSKEFMVFEGSEPTAENFMFEGDLLDFADCYFAANEWSEVLAFAADQGYTVVTEDDDRWDDLGIMLDDASLDEEEIWYDADGNESASGMYDAGGHVNAERMAEWADDYRDRMRDRDVP